MLDDEPGLVVHALTGGVDVIVAVDVIGPVIVAVHVHGNDTLIVIDDEGTTLAGSNRWSAPLQC